MSRNADNDQPRRRRVTNQGDRNADAREGGTDSQPPADAAKGGQPATPPTFGSFVSSSVRRSADRQRGESGAPTGDAASPRTRRGTSRGNEGDTPPEPTSRRAPSGRRGFVPTDDAPPPRRRPPEAVAPASTLPPVVQDVVDRVGGTRLALGLLAGAIVLLILLIVLLMNLIGGDDGGDTPPTATVAATEEDSILVPPGVPPGSGSPEATGTTAAPPPTTDTGAGPDRDTLVTPTSGSDNQLNQLPEEGTPPVSRRTGMPVVRCPDGCPEPVAIGAGRVVRQGTDSRLQ